MVQKILLWGITLFVFLLPWQARFLFVETPGTELLFSFYSLYALDLLFLPLVLLWFIWFVAKRKTIVLSISRLQRTLLLLSFVFVVFAWVSTLSSSIPEVVAFKWDRLMMGFLLFCMMVTVQVSRRRVFIALIAAALVQSLIAMQQFFLQAIPASTWLGIAAQTPSQLGTSVIEYAGGRWLRAYGSLPHPNILGAFLSLAAIAVSGWYIDMYIKISAYHKRFHEVTKDQKKRYGLQVAASFLAFGVLIVALLFTFSRSAWLGFAVGWGALVLAALMQVKGKLKGYVLVAALKQIVYACFLLGFLSFSYAPFWTSRAIETNQFTQQSLSQRAVYLNQANTLLSEHWLKGVGLGEYLFTAQQQFSYETLYEVQPVHSTWLYVWVELGLVGLGIFLLWFGSLFFFIKKVIQKKCSIDDAIVLALVVASGIMMYFDHFWWSTYFGLWLFMLITIFGFISYSHLKTRS